MIKGYLKVWICQLLDYLVWPILLISFFILPENAQSQEYVLSCDHFEVFDGLSSDVIMDVSQDRDGFIWVSTTKGLQKFDTHNFLTKIVYQENFTPTDLFIEDTSLWLFQIKERRNDGLLKAHIRFKIYDLLTGELKDIQSNSIFANKELVWVVHDETAGLFFYYENDSERKTYIYNKGFQLFAEGHTTVLHENESTKLETQIDSVLQETDNSDEKDIAKKVEITANQGKLQIDSIASQQIGLSKHNNVVYHFNKMVNAEKDSFFIEQFTKGENIGKGLPRIKIPFQDNIIDQSGRLWSWSKQNIFTQNISSGSIDDPTQHIRQKAPAATINSIFIDSNNSAWVSTQKGLFRMSYSKGMVENVLNNKSISSRAIYQVNDSTLYVNTYNGIYSINLTDRKEELLPDRKLGHLYDAVVSDDKLLLTGHAGQTYFTDVNFKNIEILRYPDLEFRNWYRSEIAVSSSGDIYYSSNKGIYQLRDSKIEKLDVGSRETKEDVFHFRFIDSQLAKCTENGIYFYDLEKQEEFHFFKDTIVSFIHPDKIDKDILWLGTKNGLIKWNRDTKTKKIYTSDNGLTSYDITSILQDKQNRLWVATFNGLNILDPKKNNIFNLFVKNGLTHNEFNYGSYLELSDGRFVFGGVDGVNIINPDKYLFEDDAIADKKKIRLKVLSTEVLSFREGRNTKLKNLNTSPEKIEFTDDVAQKTIWFSDLDYTRTKKKKYRYRIVSEKGSEEDWQFTYQNNIKLYWRPYGSYKLEVQALGSNDTPATEILEMEIEFIRPFYKSWWFYLLLIVAAFLTTYAILKQRTKALIKRNRLLQQEIETRIHETSEKNKALSEAIEFKDKLFAVLAHDLRSPLVSLQNFSNIVNYLIKKNQPERLAVIGHSIQQQITGLTNMVDNILNWSLHKDNKIPIHQISISVKDSIAELTEMYKGLLEQKNISIVNEIKNNDQIYFDKSALSTILRNMIDNALKYSQPGSSILINADNFGNKIHINVVDSGTGIDHDINFDKEDNFNESKAGTKGEKGIGMGLKVCHELALLNNAQISYRENVPEGTTFTLSASRSA